MVIAAVTLAYALGIQDTKLPVAIREEMGIILLLYSGMSHRAVCLLKDANIDAICFYHLARAVTETGVVNLYWNPDTLRVAFYDALTQKRVIFDELKRHFNIEGTVPYNSTNHYFLTNYDLENREFSSGVIPIMATALTGVLATWTAFDLTSKVSSFSRVDNIWIMTRDLFFNW